MGPPKEIHRNSSRPKHDSAKSAMVASWPRLGVSFCTSVVLAPEWAGEHRREALQELLGGLLLDRLADRLAGHGDRAHPVDVVRVLAGEQRRRRMRAPGDPEQV